MRFSTIYLSVILAALSATAQSTSASSLLIPSVTSPSSSAVTAEISCLTACDSGNVTCASQCLAIPNPDNATANATSTCEIRCPFEDEAADDITSYTDCLEGCISAYLASATTTAGPSSTESGTTAASASSSESGTASNIRIGASTAGLLGFLVAFITL